MRFILAAFLLLVGVTTYSCLPPEYEELQAADFYNILVDPVKVNSAAIWWYEGRTEQYCFFVELRPIHPAWRVKIAVSQINFDGRDSIRYPSTRSENLAVNVAKLTVLTD